MLTPDKRDHYRINDHIFVQFRYLPRETENPGDPASYFGTGPNFGTMKELYRLDLEARDMLREMAPRDRDLADFLGNLSRRVELIGHGMLAAEGEPREFDAPARLSLGGISFPTDKLVSVGSKLALKLVFRDSLLALAVFAEARHCRLAEDGERYIVGTRFIDLAPVEQDMIQRYIIHRQAEERRARLRSH